MSTTATLSQPNIDFNGEPFVFVDVDEALTPRCPRTGRTIVEHDDEASRHGSRFAGRVRQRSRAELSERQNELLFSDDTSIEDRLKVAAGKKLTKRQKAQVKLLKKQLRQRRESQTSEPIPAPGVGSKQVRCTVTTAKSHHKAGRAIDAPPIDLFDDDDAAEQDAVPMGQLLNRLQVRGRLVQLKQPDGRKVYVLNRDIRIVPAA